MLRTPRGWMQKGRRVMDKETWMKKRSDCNNKNKQHNQANSKNNTRNKQKRQQQPTKNNHSKREATAKATTTATATGTTNINTRILRQCVAARLFGREISIDISDISMLYIWVVMKVNQVLRRNIMYLNPNVSFYHSTT